MKLTLLILISLLVLFIQLGLIETMLKEPSRSSLRSHSSNRLSSPLASLTLSLDRTSTSQLRQRTSVPKYLLDKLRTQCRGEAAFQRVAKLIFGNAEKCQEKCTTEHGYYQTADQKDYLPVTEGAVKRRICTCPLQKHLYDRLKNDYGKEVADTFQKDILIGNEEEGKGILAILAYQKDDIEPIIWLTENDPEVQQYLAEKAALAKGEGGAAAVAPPGIAGTQTVKDKLTGLNNQSSVAKKQMTSRAGESTRVIIKLSDNQKKYWRKYGMEWLQEIKKGNDPCRIFRVDQLIEKYTAQDESVKCSSAITVFQSLPIESQGPCPNPGRMTDDGWFQPECFDGMGVIPGFCGVTFKSNPTHAGKKLSQWDVRRVPLINCIQHLEFEP